MPAVEVVLDGVKFLMQSTFRPLLVEARPHAVLAVAKFCQRQMKTGRGLQRAKRSSTFALPDSSCPVIKGQVTWQPSVLAWAVHYKDSQGKTRCQRIFVNSGNGGLVPAPKGQQRDLFAALSHGPEARQDFEGMRREAYAKAVTLWNQLNHSQRDRIPGSAKEECAGADRSEV